MLLLLFNQAAGSGTDDLTATGITVSPVVGTPALGQVHGLTATGITVSPSVGAPAVGQKHALTATGITCSPVVAQPSIGQKHALTAVGITVSPVVGHPALNAGTDNLSPSGITCGAPTCGTPDLAIAAPQVSQGGGGGAMRAGSGLFRRVDRDNVWLPDAVDLDLPRPVLGSPGLGVGVPELEITISDLKIEEPPAPVIHALEPRSLDLSAPIMGKPSVGLDAHSEVIAALMHRLDLLERQNEFLAARVKRLQADNEALLMMAIAA